MRFVVITLEGRCLRVVTSVTGETLVRADEAEPCDGAVFERIDLAHGRVALRVADGRYLARHVAHPDEDGNDPGASLRLVDELTQCAAFEELPVPGGSVALRGCDLRYLGVHASGAVVADRVSDGSWERFRYHEVGAWAVPQPRPSTQPPTGPPAEPVALAAV